jgi:hypothetical protein
MSMKIRMTPSGIDPANFRFVAQFYEDELPLLPNQKRWDSSGHPSSVVKNGLQLTILN